MSRSSARIFSLRGEKSKFEGCSYRFWIAKFMKLGVFSRIWGVTQFGGGGGITVMI